MSIFTVASRYAKSLIELSKEQGNLDIVKTDIDGVIAVLKSNTELQAVLKNPILSGDKKLNVLNALFGGKVNPLILSFFWNLSKKKVVQLSSWILHLSLFVNTMRLKALLKRPLLPQVHYRMQI